MVERIPFVKMHGLGNDFVIIDAIHLFPNIQSIVEGNTFSQIQIGDLTNKISDRKFGIGCDQLILYTHYKDKILMKIYNPDGSNAKACGNASRCLSRLIFDNKGLRDIALDVDGRTVLCHYISDREIQVNMGEANFNSEWMPKEHELWEVAAKLAIDLKEMICVDIGNPHIVIFTRLSSQDMNIIGKLFQKSELFKDGVNVNFAAITEDTINLKVWERGTGFTLACGSGACASYAAAYKLGFVGNDAEVRFESGTLKMSSKGNHILMTGPAEYVFRGEYFDD